MIVVRYRPRATGSGFATSASFGVPVVQDSMRQATASRVSTRIAPANRVHRIAKSSMNVLRSALDSSPVAHQLLDRTPGLPGPAGSDGGPRERPGPQLV